ncbi:MAG TPA: formate/nitrite transporter family protein [Rubricoccaceae bacterium]|nr:formate/nitrite transporter family protein [Rubricoccaceae bacterium]
METHPLPPEGGPSAGHLKQAAEAADAASRSAPGGRVVYEAILIEGEEELARPSSALFWSGLAAGLSMGFSLVAQGLLQAALPGTPWRTLVAKLGYSIGFLLVILGRQQLFTENTLTPVLPLLKRKDASTAGHVLRLWGVVLAANLLGALVFALVAARTTAFDPEVRAAFVEIGRRAMEPGFATVLLRGIFAGWLIALLVWLLPYAESARVLVIVIVTYLVGVAHLSHIIAGSVDTFALAAAGRASWGAVLLGYTLPTLIGNVLGGVTLVAALNHAQIVSGRS